MNYTKKFNSKGHTITATVTIPVPSYNYFSVTGEIAYKSGNVYTCGCIHKELLKSFPHIKDAIALHLSDANGIPMHVLENGYYYLTHKEEFSINVVMEHFRIDKTEAEILYSLDKNALSKWIETQKPRWKAEADKVIAIYSK